jgi:glucuronate isomerase
MHTTWHLPEDRYFDPEPTRNRIARQLYETVAGLPIVSPHGHVDPKLLADENLSFGTPAELFIIPDHYVFRMLYSQGIPLESLGIPSADGAKVEPDHRKIWQLFADNFHLFRATPTGMWLTHELRSVFGIEQKLAGVTAQSIYDELTEKLARPEFRPRALFERFNIEVLCTTDAATDTLAHHDAIRRSGWRGCVRPTFRPDAVVNIGAPGWREAMEELATVSGMEIRSFDSYIHALEGRRQWFRDRGARATDHAAETAFTSELAANEADAIFQRALQGRASEDDRRLFAGHMLMEMARMSVEDGLVMQLHVGALRNHNASLAARFGENKGADIPVHCEFTVNLKPLLNKYGNDSRLALILFTLDESTYARELAPIAGHYPAVKLGPPWWFHDSLNGMQRYFDRIMETAGLHNTAGFNDDTRAFASIPARHDLWRRASADWAAGLVARGIVDLDDARGMCHDLAYGLVKRAYRL